MNTLTEQYFPTLKDFLEKYRDRVISLRKFLTLSKGINHYLLSFPVLATYYDLLGFLEKRRAVFMDGLALLLDKRVVVHLSGDYDFSLLEGWTIKTCSKFPFDGKRSFLETVYVFDELFDSQRYRREERKRRLKRPLKVIEKDRVQIRILEEDWAKKAIALSERWEDEKIRSGKVYMQGFPRGEFRRMLERFLVWRKLGVLDGYLFGVFVKDKPYYIGVDVFVSPKVVFGICGFALYFDFDKSYGNESFLSECMFLKERGHKSLNVGFSTDKGVRRFKEKWVHRSLKSFQYRISRIS